MSNVNDPYGPIPPFQDLLHEIDHLVGLLHAEVTRRGDDVPEWLLASRQSAARLQTYLRLEREEQRERLLGVVALLDKTRDAFHSKQVQRARSILEELALGEHGTSRAQAGPSTPRTGGWRAWAAKAFGVPPARPAHYRPKHAEDFLSAALDEVTAAWAMMHSAVPPLNGPMSSPGLVEFGLFGHTLSFKQPLNEPVVIIASTLHPDDEIELTVTPAGIKRRGEYVTFEDVIDDVIVDLYAGVFGKPR